MNSEKFTPDYMKIKGQGLDEFINWIWHEFGEDKAKAAKDALEKSGIFDFTGNDDD